MRKTPARHRGFLLRGSRLIRSARAECGLGRLYLTGTNGLASGALQGCASPPGCPVRCSKVTADLCYFSNRRSYVAHESGVIEIGTRADRYLHPAISRHVCHFNFANIHHEGRRKQTSATDDTGDPSSEQLRRDFRRDGIIPVRLPVPEVETITARDLLCDVVHAHPLRLSLTRAACGSGCGGILTGSLKKRGRFAPLARPSEFQKKRAPWLPPFAVMTCLLREADAAKSPNKSTVVLPCPKSGSPHPKGMAGAGIA